ncbi:hypothetical protein ABZP36_022748 [Zizania latifolia]
MSEMEGALRSCMEQLLIAREEREQIIVEAASEISSEQKKARELQRKLDAASKKAAKLAAENSNLTKAVDAKDALISELKQSKSASDGELADARTKLDAAQKQSSSLQYEVRMLQKELEIRSQEREYDLQSVDASRRQQAENLKKIAQLEDECQRLRAMVRKRLPGPAAIAKMRDEVDQPAGAIPRRPRSVAPMSPRSVAPMSPRSVAPMSPRPMTPMSSRPMTPMSARPTTPRRASESETYMAKLRVVEDENNALKQTLAKRDAELQFVQMKYADEACKLSVVQRQLSELTEENKQLSDANGQTESWASALISELEQFRAGKQGMSLLDDFAEIERLEMASGGQGLRPSGASPKKAHSKPVLSEKDVKDPVQENGICNGSSEWVQDICKLVMHKHENSGENIATILQEISRALDQSATNHKGDALSEYDQTKIKEMVSSLTEKITSIIGISAESNVANSEQLLLDKAEFSARLEHLVHVCHDLLHGKSNLEKFVHEVCLILEYILSQYLSFQEQSDTVDKNTKNFDGDGSLIIVKMNGSCDMESPKSAHALEVQTEAHKESIQSTEGQKQDHILVNQHEIQLDEELARVILDQNEKINQDNSTSWEIESPPADPSAECPAQEEKQLVSGSEISAAADKLAECQETITNISKQLQALKSPTISGSLDRSMSNPRPSSAKSDYKPQSLASILAEEDCSTEDSSSPAPKEVHSKKESYAVSRKSVAQERSDNAALYAVDEKSTQNTVYPVLPYSPGTISADPKKKKRSPSLLGRIIFRKKVEGS